MSLFAEVQNIVSEFLEFCTRFWLEVLTGPIGNDMFRISNWKSRHWWRFSILTVVVFLAVAIAQQHWPWSFAAFVGAIFIVPLLFGVISNLSEGWYPDSSGDSD